MSKEAAALVSWASEVHPPQVKSRITVRDKAHATYLNIEHNEIGLYQIVFGESENFRTTDLFVIKIWTLYQKNSE